MDIKILKINFTDKGIGAGFGGGGGGGPWGPSRRRRSSSSDSW